ncbi:hypothetical protein TrCOL_g10920 [Triparma columacea]|uniref:Uncharacterized protein n=1 Tax=Triparma columacea TaxID=722753 RepID=A0A9W7G0M7_9STRA|nr:hypothetical protein TrCOL_g10920 [Triparma columacea]
MYKNPSRNSFSSVLPTSSFPASRNKKLQHKFLGLEWKFLEDTEFGETIALDRAIDLNESMFTSGQNKQSLRSPRSPRLEFDKSATIFSSSTPRKPNGLVPEETDTAEDILDAVALQILDDEYESIKANEKLGLIDKKSKKGGFIKQILGVFQDASDDHFVRKLSMKRAEQERKEKEEEVNLDVDDTSVKNPGYLLVPGAETAKLHAQAQAQDSISLDERVEKTKTAAQRLGSAVHFFDTTIHPELKVDAGPSSASERNAEGGEKEGTQKMRSRSTVIDAEKIDKFQVELPVHVDRPPSPIVFARSLRPIKIAQDVPDILLVTEHKQRAAMSVTATKSLHSYAKAAVDEIWKHDDESSSSSSSSSDSSGSPRGGRRSARKSRRSARKSRSPTAGRKSVSPHVRYGAWYINPEKWSVGMYNVLNEMAAKQQGSWGVEMASIKAKADDLQKEIPKLFIGKAFTKDLVGKGRRLPHFLSRVVLEDDVNIKWLKDLARAEANRPKPEGREGRPTIQGGDTFVAVKPVKPVAATASPMQRGRRTMTIYKKRDPHE